MCNDRLLVEFYAQIGELPFTYRSYFRILSMKWKSLDIMSQLDATASPNLNIQVPTFIFYTHHVNLPFLREG